MYAVLSVVGEKVSVMASTVIMYATVLVIIFGAFLHVSALRELRQCLSMGLVNDDMFRWLLHEYVFGSNVPRRLQRRYLLSLFLGSLALSGLALLYWLAANYARMIMVCLLLFPSLVMNFTSWTRFRDSPSS